MHFWRIGKESALESVACRTIRIATGSGGVACRYFPVRRSDRAVIWPERRVDGSGIGFDPLAARLAREGIASIEVRLRRPDDLFSCVLDVLSAITFLTQQGFRSLGLVGHSSAGALMTRAASQSPRVRTVMTLDGPADEEVLHWLLKELGPDHRQRASA